MVGAEPGSGLEHRDVDLLGPVSYRPGAVDAVAQGDLVALRERWPAVAASRPSATVTVCADRVHTCRSEPHDYAHGRMPGTNALVRTHLQITILMRASGATADVSHATIRGHRPGWP
jgi:hypothetical protein